MTALRILDIRRIEVNRGCLGTQYLGWTVIVIGHCRQIVGYSDLIIVDLPAGAGTIGIIDPDPEIISAQLGRTRWGEISDPEIGCGLVCQRR